VQDVPAGTESEFDEDLSDGPPRLLIVEDNEDSREMLTDALSSKGITFAALAMVQAPSTLR
jgi:CheY-like chemotaxis protein